MANEMITKETIHRLLKDVKQIMKHPLTEHGIYYIHDDADMLTGYAMIVGTSDTPYFGGYYFFKFRFPVDYPYSPPTVTYHTNNGEVRFNPNLYVNGKVCVSILNTWRGEPWSSCQTITTVLLTLCTLFCKNPIINEPGLTINHPDCERYNTILFYSNIKTAICDILQEKSGVFLPWFSMFLPYAKEIFSKNYPAILNSLESLKGKAPLRIETNVYSMKVGIDYGGLYRTVKSIIIPLDIPLEKV
jgi:ubiquitin-protein ligase